MKKTIFALALLVGIAFSASTYANLQDEPTAQKTETVKQDDKKSDASCSDKKKDDASCKKECTKKSDKSAGTTETK